MRKVETRPPSFPDAPVDVPLEVAPGVCWQVLCGDQGHWRLGIYSPSMQHLSEVKELERHDCPELFALLDGRVTLVLERDGRRVELPLEPGKPVLVTCPHSGLCPDGPYTGRALVVERDSFDTVYR